MTPRLESTFLYIMHWEDSRLEGKVTMDEGGKTRYGISQRANPDLTETNFYSLVEPYALNRAKQIYEQRYFNRIQAERIVNDAVRNKIADMYINMGVKGILLAQEAVGVKPDGGVGSITLTHWNMASGDALVGHLAEVSVTYYRQIAGTKEEHESWEARAACLGVIGQNLKLYRSGVDEQVLIPEQHG